MAPKRDHVPESEFRRLLTNAVRQLRDELRDHEARLAVLEHQRGGGAQRHHEAGPEIFPRSREPSE